jgi:hypothetical protein
MDNVWQRDCEKRKWVPYAVVGDANGTYKGIEMVDIPADIVNAAMNTTIIIERMLRMGRSRIRP